MLCNYKGYLENVRKTLACCDHVLLSIHFLVFKSVVFYGRSSSSVVVRETIWRGKWGQPECKGERVTSQNNGYGDGLSHCGLTAQFLILHTRALFNDVSPLHVHTHTSMR